MCREDTCPCDISGKALGWNLLSKKQLDDEYKATSREADSFFFKDGGYMNYDACILGAEKDQVPPLDPEFVEFAQGFRQ